MLFQRLFCLVGDRWSRITTTPAADRSCEAAGECYYVHFYLQRSQYSMAYNHLREIEQKYKHYR